MVAVTEFDPDPKARVIYKLRELKGVDELGGTMRLGGQECELKTGSLVRKIYGADRIVERHRHRYEVNNHYLPRLQEAGLAVSGLSLTGDLCEMVEIPGHPWFVGCQFHPEFTSTPRGGHPLFKSFVEAALVHARSARRTPQVLGAHLQRAVGGTA